MYEKQKLVGLVYLHYTNIVVCSKALINEGVYDLGWSLAIGHQRW